MSEETSKIMAKLYKLAKGDMDKVYDCLRDSMEANNGVAELNDVVKRLQEKMGEDWGY